MSRPTKKRLSGVSKFGITALELTRRIASGCFTCSNASTPITIGQAPGSDYPSARGSWNVTEVESEWNRKREKAAASISRFQNCPPLLNPSNLNKTILNKTILYEAIVVEQPHDR